MRFQGKPVWVGQISRDIGSLFVTRNEFPREALMEALLRFVEEDLNSTGR
jgi:hypothetical protein